MSTFVQKQTIEIYKSIVDYNPDAIFAFSLDGKIVDANQAASEILGYSKEELRQRSYQDLIISERPEQASQCIAKVLQGAPFEYEAQSCHQNGDVVHLLIKNIPVMAEGEVVGIWGVAKDITHLKKMEESLKHSERRYRRLVERLPEAILVHQQGILRYINPAGIRLLGFGSASEMEGKPISELVHPDDKGSLFHQPLPFSRVDANAREETIVRLDGTRMDVEVVEIGITYESQPAVEWMLRDITVRKKEAEALRKSEEKYRLIAENMTDIVLVLDSKGIIQYASPSHQSALGLSPEKLEGKLALKCVCPDDRTQVYRKFLKIFLTKETQIVVFRCKHEMSNDYVWIEAKGTPILDENANIVRFQVVARDITERKRLAEKLGFMAYHDPLTGIPNRRLFQERLAQSVKDAERYQRKFAVMYLDMDNFKQLNDTLGHDVGDELLKHFSQKVRESLRDSDTVARQGGDEFTVLLPEIGDEQAALEVAKRILSSLANPLQVGEHTFQISASIGIALYPTDGTTSDQLLKYADDALYEGKKQGRNNVKIYSSLEKRQTSGDSE